MRSSFACLIMGERPSEAKESLGWHHEVHARGMSFRENRIRPPSVLSRRPPHRRVGCVTAVVATLWLLAAPEALAHHSVGGIPLDNMFPTARTSQFCVAEKWHPCQTDNATLTIHKANTLTDFGKQNVDQTLFGSYDTTDLNVYKHPDPIWTGPGETDVIYRVNANDVPDGHLGGVWCDDASNGAIAECDQFYAAFRNQPSVALACHETGHTVGLTHGSDAYPQVPDDHYDLRCLRDPLISTDPYVGPHNVDQIDDTY
jgi:hypothetical protein